MALPVLQLGTQSEYVPQLRAKLVQLGFSITEPTSDPTIFDSAVQSAVVAFQSKAGLQPDGVVGISTWAKLGADAQMVMTTAPSWMKLGLMAVVLGGLYYWWRKRRKPYNEFNRRQMSSYGDAVDTSLIEEPLLLVERGDCEGAARLLMKRRVYASGRGGQQSTPKNRELFKKVARRVIASCGRDVEPLVREAIERSEEEGATPSPWWTKQMTSKQAREMRKHYRPAPGTDIEAARLKMSKLYRHGQKLPAQFIRRGEQVLYPMIRGGKVVYAPKGSRADRPGSTVSSKPLTEAQKEKMRERVALLREKRREAKQAANDLRRSLPRLRREDPRDPSRSRTILPRDDD